MKLMSLFPMSLTKANTPITSSLARSSARLSNSTHKSTSNSTSNLMGAHASQKLANNWFSKCLLVMSLLLASTVQAQVQSVMEMYLVTTDAEGAEQFAKAETAQPGNVIEYRLAYRNEGDSAIYDITVTGPIPNDTQYLAASAKADIEHELKVSVDGGATWDNVPVLRTRELEDGSTVEVVIPPEQYTQIRWYTKGRLSEEAQQNFSYRVKIKE